MRRALQLARRGEGLTRPNPPVGAVIVKNGRAVGEGFHRRAGGPHAEVVALRRAGARARNSTLYVTLEPCSTWGRTPPCTEAILAAGVKRVVVATRDPNPRHRGRGLRFLARHGVIVSEGVERGAAKELLAPFARWVCDGRPYVTLKLATSLDGRIADRAGRSRWISGFSARRRVHAWRRQADAIMVGAGTVRRDDPSLLPRPARGRWPWRVVVDRDGSTPLSCRLVREARKGRVLLATGAACSLARRRAYCKAGLEVVTLPERRGELDLSALLRELAARGILHVLCEGGSELAGSLLRQGLVDEVRFFIAPRVLGGDGVGALAGAGWPLAAAPRLAWVGLEQVGRDILVRARVCSRRGRRPSVHAG